MNDCVESEGLKQMSPPNILFIMADQQRYDYLGYAGSDFVNTPNLDKLAARGTVFSQCTTNSPVCAASRISLATGLQPFRTGAFLGNTAFLPQSLTTYYQRLRDHGYRVGCVGKLDLAKPDRYNGRYGDRPCVYSWGFTHPEECEGKMHAGSSVTPIGPYTHYLHEKGLLKQFKEDYDRRRRIGWFKALEDSAVPCEDFEDVYIGRRAAEWIKNIPDDFPWHYFVSFVGPHDPFDAPKEYADKYRNKKMPSPIPPRDENRPAYYAKRQCGMTPDEIEKSRQMYCAAIELIDDQVGEMVKALEERDMLDNTLIIFSSDHGEMLGDHGLYQKSLPYEHALRVPLLMAGPGVPSAKITDTPVELIDLNPTICEAAGLPPQPDIDAQSLFPFLRGERDEHREDSFSMMQNFMCIRTKTHKFINNQNDIPECYDLENDPDELTNLCGKSDVVRDLRRRLSRRFTEAKSYR